MTYAMLKQLKAITPVVRFTRVETRVTGADSADLIVDEKLRIPAPAGDVVESMRLLRDLDPGQSVRIYGDDGSERILVRI